MVYLGYKCCGAGVLRSTDKGSSWRADGCLRSERAGWLIENSVAQLADGTNYYNISCKCVSELTVLILNILMPIRVNVYHSV